MDSVIARSHTTGCLSLRIAEIQITVSSVNSALRLGVEGPMAQFVVSDGVPASTIRAKWGAGDRRGGRRILFDSGGLWQLYRQGSDYLFQFVSPIFGTIPYKEALFDQQFTVGEVALRSDAVTSRQSVNPLEYPLDELLMVHLLSEGRGVEVHGCGVLDTDGLGYLFLGQSGAGKTTIARLWDATGAAVLSDDRIVLRLLEGRLWMYGTPWHGDAELACARRAPLTRIWFLEHALQNESIAVRPAEAVSRLIAASFVPFYSPRGLEFTLEFCQQAARMVPCAKLRFEPDGRVLDFIHRETV